MNKKGIILKETLGVIIAVLGIVAIIFLGVKLYSFNSSQESENAKIAVEIIEARIQNLAVGQAGTFPLRGPCSDPEDCSWFLTGFSRDADKPARCLGSSCICMCSGDSDDLVGSCEDDGICRNIDYDKLSIGSSRIVSDDGNAFSAGAASNFGRVSSVQNVRYIGFDTPLIEVLIEKGEDEITISPLYNE